jgi:hypothetical protein
MNKTLIPQVSYFQFTWFAHMTVRFALPGPKLWNTR